MVSQVHTYVKTDQIVHCKYVQFVVGELDLNKAVKKLRPQVPQTHTWDADLTGLEQFS